MAKRTIRVDYTLYTPGYNRDTGLCLDFLTLERAKQYARGAGKGTWIVRNFNTRGPNNEFDWCQDGRCWYFDGLLFVRMDSAQEKKWRFTSEQIRRTGPIRTCKRLTYLQRAGIIRKLRRLPVDAIEPR